MPIEVKKHEPIVLRAMSTNWVRLRKGDNPLIENWKLLDEAEGVYLRCADLEELVKYIGAERTANGIWFLPFYLKDGTCEMMPMPLWLKRRQEAAELLAAAKHGQ